jgi:hypothetical protein
MDFNTYGLNQKWMVLTVVIKRRTDYGLILNFKQIDISPEQIKEKEFVKRKKQIKMV